MHRRSIAVLVGALATASLLVARPALAGAPLICFPFDIGAARSLPILQTGYGAVDPKYDVSRLVADTIELLDAKAPIIVHMETIRRAALYAERNPKAGAALLAALQTRAGVPGPDAPAAVFDFGYLVETYKQGRVPVAGDADGYVWIQKAIALRGDPQMELPAAIISAWPKRPDNAALVRTATLAAKSDELLSRNRPGRIPATEP